MIFLTFNINKKKYIINKQLYNIFKQYKIINYLQELLYLGFYYNTIVSNTLTLSNFKNYPSYTILKKNILNNINKIYEYNLYSTNNKLSNPTEKLYYLDKLNYFNTYFKLISSYSNFLIYLANNNIKINWNTINQLINVRGYLSNAKGIKKSIPILNSFNKGLNLFEFIISCFGARKGIVDTALQTAESGYLTRRIIESINDVRIVEYYCGSKNSTKININLSALSDIKYINKYSILYHNLAKPILNKLTGNIIYLSNTIISTSLYNTILKQNLNKIFIYDSFFCLSNKMLCLNCYGLNKLTNSFNSKNIGTIIGEFIGEPSTQLTLRTFHTGGVFELETSYNKKLINFKNKISNYYNNNLLYNYKKGIITNIYKYKNINIINFKSTKSLLLLSKNFNTIFFNKNSLLLFNNRLLFNKNVIFKLNLKRIHLNSNIDVNKIKIYFKNNIQLLFNLQNFNWNLITLIPSIMYSNKLICISNITKKGLIKNFNTYTITNKTKMLYKPYILYYNNTEYIYIYKLNYKIYNYKIKYLGINK